MKPVIPRNYESLSDAVLSRFPLARAWYRFLSDSLRTLLTHTHDGNDTAAIAAASVTVATTSFDGALTSADNTVQKALDTLDDSSGYITKQFDNILRSPLDHHPSSFLTMVADTAYFVYLGRTTRAITPKYVEFFVYTAGTGAQTVEVGFFSSPAAPNKANQSLTKLVSDGTVSDLTTTGVKRNTNAFATAIPVGTYLWAGIRTNMATTQPVVYGQGQDWNQGACLSTAAAGALTGAGPWTGATIGTSATSVPMLRGSLV
jgi:hypothetical protein